MSTMVIIPHALSQYTGGSSEIRVDASTVDQALSKVDQLFPGLRAFLVNESHELRRYVNIFVNDHDVRLGAGLMTSLKDGDLIKIVPAIAGG